MMLRYTALALLAATSLAGCTAQSVWAPDDVVARATYRHAGPPALTLYTMVNNRTGAGAHTSLMINASQRVIFDPAGTVKHTSIPERNDVLYGITPEIKEFYARAHARKTYHVEIQRIEVSAEVAEMAFQMVKANGAVPSAKCALTTSTILSRLPGFESISPGWYPNKLADQFARLPGVVETSLFENDDEDKAVAIAIYDAKINARDQVIAAEANVQTQ
jgi:hypothetical protein